VSVKVGVAALGNLAEVSADREIDSSGQVVAPGIVDIHTHYDPQITFDPWATTSSLHGVTTVVGGNCGFSLAPCRGQDRDFIRGIFSMVEQMDPLASMGVRFEDFETFAEFPASVHSGPCFIQGHGTRPGSKRWQRNCCDSLATPFVRSVVCYYSRRTTSHSRWPRNSSADSQCTQYREHASDQIDILS
jgi:hypothetical protein